jgi:hypothetical protein
MRSILARPVGTGSREPECRLSAVTESGPTPLVRLRRSGLLFAVCALAGGIVGFGATAIRAPRYRATATLLVVEPRGAQPGSVDYQLTPIRSYTALLGSPALAASCATGGSPPRVKVRMPESTRLLEISAEGEDATAVATFAGCLATRAVEENRRLNADVARRGESQIAAALQAARTNVEQQELEVTRARASALIELKRAQLKAALGEIAAATEGERIARQNVEEEEARRKSFEERVDLAPAARETAEIGAARAQANAAASRAAIITASKARTAAEARAALLEREICSREEELVRRKRRIESTTAGVTELEKRTALAPLESASKAFDLQLVAPPPPVAPRVGPSPLLVAAIGALAAVFLGALVVLSRPE